MPLTFHFTGRVMYQGPQHQVQERHIPWHTSAQYRMPVSAWKNMIAHHHGESGFVVLHDDTLDELKRYKRVRGLHSFDAVVLDMLERAPADETQGASA